MAQGTTPSIEVLHPVLFEAYSIPALAVPLGVAGFAGHGRRHFAAAKPRSASFVSDNSFCVSASCLISCCADSGGNMLPIKSATIIRTMANSVSVKPACCVVRGGIIWLIAIGRQAHVGIDAHDDVVECG